MLFSWKGIKSIQGVAFHDKHSQLPTEWMLKCFFAVNSIFHEFCAIYPCKIDENQLFQNFSKIIFFMICHKQNWDNDQFWWFLSLFFQETQCSDILRDLKFESVKMSILRNFVCNFVCFLWPHWVPCGVPRWWFSEKLLSKE